MPPSPHEPAWRATLAALGRVNGSIEVQARSPHDAREYAFNARVLETNPEDGSVVIERPPHLDPSVLAAGVALRLFALVGELRLSGRTRVARSGRYRLNDQVRVTAVQLDPITDLAPSQRRACFRASTATADLPGVVLRLPNLPAIPAELLDVSDIGVGLGCTLEPALARSQRGARARVVLPLDPEQAPLEPAATVVRIERSPRGTWMIGLRFEFASPAEQQHAERLIQRFSADRQRMHLRNLRAAG